MRDVSIISVGLMLLSLHSFAADHQDTCRDLVTPQKLGVLDLSTEAKSSLVAVAQQNRREHNAAQLISNLQMVIRDLVDRGELSALQAQEVFGERVLGNFSQIFLKYAIAELRQRGFNQTQVVNFILQFDHVFSAERQIEFAISVANRMLYTVQDDPTLANPQGLDGFLKAAQAFGVTTEVYSDFLKVWMYVSTAEPAAIVHFILSNIRNAGVEINSDIQRQMTAEAASASRVAPPPPAGFFARLFGRRSVITTPRARTAQDIAEHLLSVRNIPQFILDLSSLEPPKTKPRSLWHQSLKGQPPSEHAIDRVLVSPRNYTRPVVNHVFRMMLSYMDAQRLTQILSMVQDPKDPIFVQPEILEAMRNRLTTFQSLAQLNEKLQAVYQSHLQRVQRESRQTETELRSTQVPISKDLPTELNRPYVRLTRTLQSTPMTNHQHNVVRIVEALNVFFNELDDAKLLKLPVSSQIFTEVAGRIIEMIFKEEKERVSLAVGDWLKQKSKQFLLNEDQIEDLIKRIGRHRVNVRGDSYTAAYNGPIEQRDAFKHILSREGWGLRAYVTEEQIRTRTREAVLSDLDFQKIVAEVQSILAVDPSSTVTTETIYAELLEAKGSSSSRRSGSRGRDIEEMLLR